MGRQTVAEESLDIIPSPTQSPQARIFPNPLSRFHHFKAKYSAKIANIYETPSLFSMPENWIFLGYSVTKADMSIAPFPRISNRRRIFNIVTQATNEYKTLNIWQEE